MSKSKNACAVSANMFAEKSIHVLLLLPEPILQHLLEQVEKSRLPLALIIRKALISYIAQNAGCRHE